MNRTARATAMLIGLLLVVMPITFAQSTPRETDSERPIPIEERLEDLAERLRLSLTVASVAAYSPTLADMRHHAQQLINLIEGRQGPHYAMPAQPLDDWPGMLPEVVVISSRFDAQTLEPETRIQVATAMKNARTFLTLALNAALSAGEQHRLDLAALDMLRVYAYLAAAYETPCDAAYLPGLWTVLRIVESTSDEPNV